MYKRRMEHQSLLQMVTNEWESKSRIHREAARYWDITRQCATDTTEQERANERYQCEMRQAQYAHEKLLLCLGLKSAL